MMQASTSIVSDTAGVYGSQTTKRDSAVQRNDNQGNEQVISSGQLALIEQDFNQRQQDRSQFQSNELQTYKQIESFGYPDSGLVALDIRV